jgi:hypothetical protein
LVRIEDAGHFIPEEEPEELIMEMRDLLAERAPVQRCSGLRQYFSTNDKTKKCEQIKPECVFLQNDSLQKSRAAIIFKKSFT